MEPPRADITGYVAFLRGINVGGANLVAMSTLRASFEQLGHSHVRTHLNTGNVLFQAKTTDAHVLEDDLEAALVPLFAEPIHVMLRSEQQMRETVASIPIGWQARQGQRCNVIFLHRSIDRPELVDGFTLRPYLEELRYTPGALLWSATLDGLTRSTMAKLSRLPIYQKMTVRRLSTVRHINDLLSG
jgi:uncharacterized protein (DUF1697 family)